MGTYWQYDIGFSIFSLFNAVRDVPLSLTWWHVSKCPWGTLVVFHGILEVPKWVLDAYLSSGGVRRIDGYVLSFEDYWESVFSRLLLASPVPVWEPPFISCFLPLSSLGRVKVPVLDLLLHMIPHELLKLQLSKALSQD